MSSTPGFHLQHIHRALSTSLQTEPDLLTRMACFLPTPPLQTVPLKSVCGYVCVPWKSPMRWTKWEHLRVQVFQNISNIGRGSRGLKFHKKFPLRNFEDCQKVINSLFCQVRISLEQLVTSSLPSSHEERVVHILKHSCTQTHTSLHTHTHSHTCTHTPSGHNLCKQNE